MNSDWLMPCFTVIKEKSTSFTENKYCTKSHRHKTLVYTIISTWCNFHVTLSHQASLRTVPGRMMFGCYCTSRSVRRYGRPPLSCWHGTSNQLPVKLSVGTADPGGTQHWALLKSHRSPCWFCSGKTRCLHVVEVKQRELWERVREEARQRYVARPLLKAINHSFCFVLPKFKKRKGPHSCLPQRNSTLWGRYLWFQSCTLAGHISLSV